MGEANHLLIFWLVLQRHGFSSKTRRKLIWLISKYHYVGKVKAHELRTKSKGELLTQLKELKEELSTVGWCLVEWFCRNHEKLVICHYWLVNTVYVPASCRPSDKLRTCQDLENFNCQKINCESIDRSQSACKIKGNLKSLSPRV